MILRRETPNRLAPGGTPGIDTPPFNIVTFYGGKGGVGTTTLAVETAALLSMAGHDVVAVDLDLYGPDLHYRMDVPIGRGSYTIADLVPVAEELDEHVLRNALSDCRRGVRLLPAPASPWDAPLLRAEHVRGILRHLVRICDCVIVDTCSRLDGVTAAAMSEADLQVLVSTPELSSLGGLRRAIEFLDGIDAFAARRILVLNRSLGKGDSVSIVDVKSFLGLPVKAVITEEAQAFRLAADEGRAIVASSTSTGSRVLISLRRLLAD
jgi:MinD-like ATPase involved in chromosome partitioning or flagellar assembly